MNQIQTFSMPFRTYVLAALIIVWAGGLTARGDNTNFNDLSIGDRFSPNPSNNTFESGGIDFTVISGPDATGSDVVVFDGAFAKLPVSGTHLFFNNNVGVAVSLDPATESLSFSFEFGDEVTLNVNGDSVFVERDLRQLDGTTIGNVSVSVDSSDSATPFDRRGILRLEGEINSFAITGTELAFDNFSVPASFGQATGLIRNFDDPTPNDGDFFGGSVVIDGNRILVGASGDDTNGRNVGQAYLFDATTGSLVFTLDDPTPSADDFSGDRFGYSIAIDGNHVLVGAPNDDTIGRSVGQAHLFDATTGNLVFTFDDPTPSADDLSGDRFGSSVAIDGNHVLVGAPLDRTNGLRVGQAHLFDATTGNLVFTFDAPTPTDFEYFGDSVAIDGNHVIIGAPGDSTNGENTGQAYLFDATTGNLVFTFDAPTPSPQEESFGSFGSSVAIDGSHVIVAAPGDSKANLFDATTGDLVFTFDAPTPPADDRLGDFFGESVAIDSNHVLVGAPNDDTNGRSVGQAYLFDATTGDLVFTFDAPTPTDFEYFGGSVAIDGNRVLIGASGDDTNGRSAGQASLFSLSETITGDFDADGDVDGDDVDFYIGNLDQPATGELAQLDLDGDGEVTLADHDLFVTTLVVTFNGITGALLGDVDLDGEVDVLSDAFALVGSLGMSVTSRSQGDLNADGTVDVLNDAFRLIADLGQSNED
ncbi:PQQ-binding-like beta-propeller repeat protein [Mariniblastus sp.]|nr:PQQ-binding-like beta-propeller repeat protein [Mariniblastus sp.]